MVTKGEVIKEPVQISVILKEALALGLMGVRKGDLVVKREIDDLLLVVVDVVQLQQVLLNLIRNAVEAMSESKIRELTIGARQAGDKVIIEISRSEEHTSELQSLMRSSYAVFCLKTKIEKTT